MHLERFVATSLMVLVFAGPWAALAGDAADDGTYDAQVTTQSGTYSVPVEVEDGQVTRVYWPNGGDMTVNDAELDGGQASGTNSRGDTVEIEIDNSGYSASPSKE